MQLDRPEAGNYDSTVIVIRLSQTHVRSYLHRDIGVAAVLSLISVGPPVSRVSMLRREHSSSPVQ